MTQILVTEAGYYGGKFLTAGQHYDDADQPTGADAAVVKTDVKAQQIAAAQKSVDDATAKVTAAKDDASKQSAEAELETAKANLAALQA